MPSATAAAAATPPSSYTTIPQLARNKRFRAAAARALELKRLIIAGKAAEEELKRHNADELEPELIAAGVRERTTIEYEGAKVCIMTKAGGSRIDEKLLMQHQVSKKIIAACTVQSKDSHYIDVRLPLEAENAVLREHGLPEKVAKKGSSGATEGGEE